MTINVNSPIYFICAQARCTTKEAGLLELLTASGKQIGNSSEEQKQTAGFSWRSLTLRKEMRGPN